MSIAFAVRTGVFDLTDKTISDEELKALWAFIATGLGTAATIIGLLFTKSHNARTLALQAEAEKRKSILESESEARLRLDTVVKGLDLLTATDGGYAPKAKMAGGLAALIHLGHPVIAMRTLAAAWDDNAVDPATACWLINEVLLYGSRDSKEEAAELLREHSSNLTSEQEGHYAWPTVLEGGWLTNISVNARANILFSAIALLLSRERAWWGGAFASMTMLDEALIVDDNSTIKESTAILAKPILALLRDDQFITGPAGLKIIGEMKARASQVRQESNVFSWVPELAQKIERWGEGEPVSTDLPQSAMPHADRTSVQAEDGDQRPPAGRV
jgi:hypothetical protein